MKVLINMLAGAATTLVHSYVSAHLDYSLPCLTLALALTVCMVGLSLPHSIFLAKYLISAICVKLHTGGTVLVPSP